MAHCAVRVRGESSGPIRGVFVPGLQGTSISLAQGGGSAPIVSDMSQLQHLLQGNAIPLVTMGGSPQLGLQMSYPGQNQLGLMQGQPGVQMLLNPQVLQQLLLASANSAQSQPQQG